MLGEVRKFRRRFAKHRCPLNRSLFESKRDEVMLEVEKAHERWKIARCEEVGTAKTDKEKWKRINKLTNSDQRFDIQPIRKTDSNTNSEYYLFEDSEILEEMEKYHISKQGSDGTILNREIEKLKEECSEDHGNYLMSSSITKTEVDSTFGLCTGAAGPDGVGAKLLDNASRELMSRSLEVIWNQAWDEGLYLEVWKKEHRAVLAKPNKEDFHEANAYRTVSLTSIIGKRFEKISSRRLLIFLEEIGFDSDQFAYLE